jgi:hypothetical protein
MQPMFSRFVSLRASEKVRLEAIVQKTPKSPQWQEDNVRVKSLPGSNCTKRTSFTQRQIANVSPGSVVKDTSETIDQQSLEIL